MCIGLCYSPCMNKAPRPVPPRSLRSASGGAPPLGARDRETGTTDRPWGFPAPSAMLNTPSGILSGHLCPPARLSCCRDHPECRSQAQGAGLHASVPQPLHSSPIGTSFRRTSSGSVPTTGLGPSTFLYQNHNKNMKFRSRTSWLSHIQFPRNRLCHTLALAASEVGEVGAMPPRPVPGGG